MIVNLLRGLAEIRSEWEGTLELSALSSLAFGRAPSWSTDLVAVAEEGLSHRGTAGKGLKAARRLRLSNVASSFDALHLPEINATPLLLETPLIVTCHDLIPLRWPKEYLGPLGGFEVASAVRRIKDKRRYSAAERVVCISPRTARDLEELLGIGAPRATVAWLGIDLEAWRERLDVPERLAHLGLAERRYVVFAGAGDPRKNVGGMFAALARARSEGLDVELAWAGHLSADARRGIDALVAEHGLKGYVKFLGFVEHADLIALFQGALAHVFLSRLEGFGLSVAEAMAARCPVIVARGSGSDDVAGDAALIVDGDSSEEAARALLRVAQDEALADRLRALGEERSRLYDYRRMARDYVRVYHEVVS